VSLEQNEPRSVKTSAGKRRRRLVIWVVATPALLLIVVLLGWWYGFRQEPNGSKPPAPDAPEAKQWSPEANEPMQPNEPSPDTPADTWNLPLDIVFDDIPEVPEEIRGPSPPIEVDGEVDGP